MEPARVILIRPKAVDDTGFTVERDPEDRRASSSAACARALGPADRLHQRRGRRLPRRPARRLGVEERAGQGWCAVAGDGAHRREDDAVVFDWEPTIAAGSPLTGPRGSDDRLYQ